MNETRKNAVATRKRRDRQSRIAGILAAAGKAFLEKGFSGTTMDAIAFEAGLTKPTLYRYFQSKDHLFFELLMPTIRALSDECERVETLIGSGEVHSGEEFIEELFAGLSTVYAVSPEVFRIVNKIGEENEFQNFKDSYNKTLKDKYLANLLAARRSLAAAVEKGLIRDLGTEEMTDVLYGLFSGILQTFDITTQVQNGRMAKAKRESALARRFALAKKMVTIALVKDPGD